MNRANLKIILLDQKEDQLTINLEYSFHNIRLVSQSCIPFSITEKDLESLSWYLEKFPYEPFDPNPVIAGKFEKKLQQLGENVFTQLFIENPDGAKIYDHLVNHKSSAFIEVFNRSKSDFPFPLELIKDPKQSEPLFLDIRSIVYLSPGKMTGQEISAGNNLKILLVISRPLQLTDVPFRSVARKLFDAIHALDRKNISLEVLRPPTFSTLIDRLAFGAQSGHPYSVLHFDGHGIFEDLNATMTGQPTKYFKGYILFENPAILGNTEYITGKKLGEELIKYGVYYVVLNACRSGQSNSQGTSTSTTAFSSFAGDLLKTGVKACLAMRYNIFVNTAALFMAHFYLNYCTTGNIGIAAAVARKTIFYSKDVITDWFVPTVYESEANNRIYELREEEAQVSQEYNNNDIVKRLEVDQSFQFGMDSFFLELENKFITSKAIIVKGWTLGGKTTAGRSFANWYVQTGGAKEMCYTNLGEFSNFKEFHSHFHSLFQKSDSIAVPTITNTEIPDVLSQPAKPTGVFWIIDDAHLISTLIEGKGWSVSDIDEFRVFLIKVQDTSIRILLLSSGWASDSCGLSNIIYLQSPAIEDATQFSRYIIAKEEYSTDINSWKPLIEFAQSSYLLLYESIHLAMNLKLQTFREMEHLSMQLRKGDYRGFSAVTNEKLNVYSDRLYLVAKKKLTGQETELLACLGLIQCSVNLNQFIEMTSYSLDYGPIKLQNFDNPAYANVLNFLRKTDLSAKLNDTGYILHPMSSFLIKRIYKEQIFAIYADQFEDVFIGYFSKLAGKIYDEFLKGNFADLLTLKLNRYNLWFALDMALAKKNKTALLNIFLGLVEYYERNGRFYDIMRFIKKIEPIFFDKNGNPIDINEPGWEFINEVHTRIEMDFGDREIAESLLKIKLDNQKKKVGFLLTQDLRSLNNPDRIKIHNYIVTLNEWVLLLVEKNDPSCYQYLKHSLYIAENLQDKKILATAYERMGQYYFQMNPPDAKAAFAYFRKAMDNYPVEDGEKIGRSLTHMAGALYLQCKDPNLSDEDYQKFLNYALCYCKDGLRKLPLTATASIAQGQGTMGNILSMAGYQVEAIRYYKDAISLGDKHGYFRLTNGFRVHLIAALEKTKDYELALEYANYVVSRGKEYVGQANIDYAVNIINKYKKT